MDMSSVKIDDGRNNCSLVPRPPSAVEKTEQRAKRALAVMVSDTLAVAQKNATPDLTPPTQAELENWCRLGENAFGKQEFAEAVSWYRKAAEHGHAEALAHLGTCYTFGWGVTRDTAKAAQWYSRAVKSFRTAAEHGDASAQCKLGNCYQHGQLGVPQDHAEAVTWYQRAVEQGHADAQCGLGDCVYLR